jgi:hypothetical protein
VIVGQRHSLTGNDAIVGGSSSALA